MAFSMLSVKMPWAHTRVHIKLVMGEMGNNVAVRTVSKKYRKKTSDHACWNSHHCFSVVWAQNYPVPIPSHQSDCDDSEDYSDKPASKLSILNWERREPCKNARASGYGQEKGEKCGIVSLFLLLLLLSYSSPPLFFLLRCAVSSLAERFLC